ncbi:MAG: sodium-dependent transporter [Thiomicrospira sp.]|uniref:sodium-dependent transporter n=1 Tax=Thiomicrospira sp. TaxID=935 RepID=UPI0019F2B1D5|nr:sodium-dependent transporter [Thiomicrospira sp.]MBE0494185.1 sodium-dependent transporter [Thiomicrospira sp.]
MSLLKLSTQSWSSQTVFIMAAVGSAVGLGNIWKFPYIAGDNGGGAFVLVYLACILIIGLPILLSEIALGRTGQANPVQAMANVAHESNASRLWSGLGFNGVLAGLLILSFYTVIAGIAVAYFVTSVQGAFVDISSQQAQELFEAKVASPWELLFWHSLVTVFTIVIVSKGIRSGLEKAINFMMPGLLIILLVLLGYATTTGFFGASVAFMFTPDFSKLSWEAVLVALGHAFFTLSIGLGTMMAYGAYVNQNMSIVKASVWIVLMDTLIAMMAGLVIFSVVFANDLAPGAGPGLLFQTLPIAFGQMVGGWFFGSLFFLLVVMAALSSAISLIEPAVSWFEQNWGYSRKKSAWMLGSVAWLIGLGTVLSFNYWEDIKLLGDRNFFATVDFLTSSIMLPLGGLFIGVFVAWTMRADLKAQQIDLQRWVMALFNFSLRYVTPFAIILVFAYNLSQTYIVPIMLISVAIYVVYVLRLLRLKRVKANSI